MIANDYTDLRDRPKRWWVWRFAIIIPALGAAIASFFVGVAVSGLLGSLVGSAALAGWSTLLSLVMACVVYFVWGKLKPDGMNFGTWLFAFADYAFSQPRRFYGLRADTEPTRIRWTVVIYDPLITKR